MKVISEYHVFFCVLQVIRNDALTFGSQQTRGFVLTFRRFFKGDDDNYVMIFRCKWSFHRSKRYNNYALRTLRASLRYWDFNTDSCWLWKGNWIDISDSLTLLSLKSFYMFSCFFLCFFSFIMVSLLFTINPSSRSWFTNPGGCRTEDDSRCCEMHKDILSLHGCFQK